MKRYFFALFLFLIATNLLPGIKLKSQEEFFDLICPNVVDVQRLSLVLFTPAPSYFHDPRDIYRQRSAQLEAIKKVQAQTEQIQVRWADINKPEMRELALESGFESFPVAALYKSGRLIARYVPGRGSIPVSAKVPVAEVVTYSPSIMLSRPRCNEALISDQQLFDFTMSYFGGEIRSAREQQMDHAARMILLKEPHPTLYATGGMWPDWIAAFNPWPLYWGG